MPTPQDLLLIPVLGLLEGLLSIDNALVLALQVRGLPEAQRRKALTYGLAGAVVFRLVALYLITSLMKWTWVKWVGGGYLVFIALKHLLSRKEEDDPHALGKVTQNFWKTVVMVELTDIAFAMDSILAAVALTDKIWIIFVGGFIGIIMIRYAATAFTKLLDRFPGFEAAAYYLVALIGFKLILEAVHVEGWDFESPSNPAFWVFWGLMAICLGAGFVRKKPKP